MGTTVTAKVGEMLYNNFIGTIKKYCLLEGLDRLVYLFSGGKDATIGLEFLQQYIYDNNLYIGLDVIMVDYPLHVYFTGDGIPAQVYVDTIEYWHDKGINIDIFIPDIEDLADNDPAACKVCKNVRKSYVDPYLANYQKHHSNDKIGVVTGYTLHDALAYMDEILLVSNFNCNNGHEALDIKRKNRINNCLHKMRAREDLPNGLTVIRPLIDMNEDKIMAYIKNENIPYVNRPCKAAKDKHKREYFKVLKVAEEINNTNYEGLLNFLQIMNIQFPTTFDDIQVGNYFTDC